MSDVKTAVLFTYNGFTSCGTVVSCSSYGVHYAPLIFVMFYFWRFCIYKLVVGLNILARNMLNKFLSLFRGLFTFLQLAFIKLYYEYILKNRRYISAALPSSLW